MNSNTGSSSVGVFPPVQEPLRVHLITSMEIIIPSGATTLPQISGLFHALSTCFISLTREEGSEGQHLTLHSNKDKSQVPQNVTVHFPTFWEAERLFCHILALKPQSCVDTPLSVEQGTLSDLSP